MEGEEGNRLQEIGTQQVAGKGGMLPGRMIDEGGSEKCKKNKHFALIMLAKRINQFCGFESRVLSLWSFRRIPLRLASLATSSRLAGLAKPAGEEFWRTGGWSAVSVSMAAV